MGKKGVEKFRIRKNPVNTKADACEFDDMFCSFLFFPLDRICTFLKISDQCAWLCGSGSGMT